MPAAFQAAQLRAASTINSSLAGMRGFQGALQKGDKLNASQKQIQYRINRYIGHTAGNDPTTVGAVIKAGEVMVAALQGSKPFMASPTPSGNNYAENGPNRPGTVYPLFFSASSPTRAYVMAHEAAHEKRGVKDLKFSNGIGPYGRSNAEALARYGAGVSMRNAENMAYVFGLEN